MKIPISILDLALQTKYFLLLGSLVLFFENANLIYYNKDIFYYINTPSSLSWIRGLLFLGIFFFFVSVYISLIRRPISWLLYQIGIFRDPLENRKDYKYLSILEKEAIENQNTFIREIVEDHKKKVKEMTEFQNISFSFNILFLINFYYHDRPTSLSGYLWNIISGQHGIKRFFFWTIVGIFIIFYVSILLISLEKEVEKIYFPKNESKDHPLDLPAMNINRDRIGDRG